MRVDPQPRREGSFPHGRFVVDWRVEFGALFPLVNRNFHDCSSRYKFEGLPFFVCGILHVHPSHPFIDRHYLFARHYTHPVRTKMAAQLRENTMSAIMFTSRNMIGKIESWRAMNSAGSKQDCIDLIVEQQRRIEGDRRVCRHQQRPFA